LKKDFVVMKNSHDEPAGFPARVATLLLGLAVFLFFAPPAFSQIPPGYYNSADGKTGQALRDALHGIIDDHTVIPHGGGSYDTHDALEDLHEDPGNTANVILVYSGWSVTKSSWPDWNREHSWPKSLGTDSGPALSDMFHIYACDADVNNQRGNKYFDNGGSSIPPEAPDCRYDLDSFEVRNEEKGDLARAMFYLDVRYNGDTTGELDLELTDNPALIQSGSRFMGLLTTLLEWHAGDPVDSVEVARNDFIHANIQHNRNPFVDNPDWVYAIWGGALSADTWHVSGSVASSVDFLLDGGGAMANRTYLLLGSVSGTDPGTLLPGGFETIPLNRDFFTDYILANPAAPYFTGFRGILDGSGRGAARFDTLGPLPAGLFPVGTTIHFAYTVTAPFDFVSNAIAIEVEP
jgi:endonuclease I